MKIITRIFLFLFLFFMSANHVSAYTKDDIFELVGNQTTCDGASSILFRSYNTTYTRLVKQKDLTTTEINAIMHHLNTAITILNDNKVCKLSDLSKLTTTEKRSVLNALINGSNIITNAKDIVEEEKPSGNSGLIIDKSTKAIQIYDSGVLVDQVTVQNSKLTYTGPSIWITIYILIFSISLISLVILRKSKKLVFIKDMLLTSLYVTALLIVIGTIFRDEWMEINNYISLFQKRNQVNESREIVVNKKEILRYPSLGDVYATILIPNVGIQREVSFGDSHELLNQYIGHDTSSVLPGEGGTIVYSGHNSSKFLGNLKQVKEQDLIIVETTYGTFEYAVTGTKIIEDTDDSSVFIKSEKETLVLYTCYPFSNVLYGTKRMVVYATLVEENWKVSDNNDE